MAEAEEPIVAGPGDQGKKSQYKWTQDSTGNPSNARLLKAVQQFNFLRYGEGPYNANTKELGTKKPEREAALEAYVQSNDVFKIYVGGQLVSPLELTGVAVYHRAQTEIRQFKKVYLSPGSNRSGFDGNLNALQSACLDCIKADNYCALRVATGKREAEEEAAKLASLERDLGLSGGEADAAAFKEGTHRNSMFITQLLH